MRRPKAKEPALTHPNFYGKDGKPFLVRCPKCKCENWAISVAGGVCAWCGWKAKRKGKE